MSKRTKDRRAKFYLDECVPQWVLVYLWARGYDTRLSKDDLGLRTGDLLLLKQAKIQGRVFVTLDRGIKSQVKNTNHPGTVVISGKDLTENYVCGAMDALFEWGAKRRRDYKGLYIEISENQTSIINMEDSKTLVLRADGSMTLREADGVECHGKEIIEKYLKAKDII